MDQKKQQVAVVMPVYQGTLSRTDKVALAQLQKVLGAYPKIFLAPESLTFDYGELGKGFSVERFPDEFFKSATTYSVLLLQQDFYRRFLDYDSILIYQTDAFVFSDRLREFCAMGYDFIGAPVGRYVPLWNLLGARIGNGGLSLRRPAACLRMLEEHGDWLKEGAVLQDAFLACEDAFFAACGVRDETFRVPDVRTALSFAVQDDLQHAFRRMEEGWRPFGCHSWTLSVEHGFWRKIIEAEGYDLSDVNFPDMEPYWKYYLKLRWQTHQTLPIHRIYAALRRGAGGEALALLGRALAAHHEKAPVWRLQVEDFAYLWRMSELDLADDALRNLVQRAIEEAMCRSFLSGDFHPNHVGLAETLFTFFHLSRQEHSRLHEILTAAHLQLDESTAPPPAPRVRRSKSCKIVAISMVKNEMDVIESFVRHTLGFADLLIVADHKSTDQTRGILEKLCDEGLPLFVEDVRTATYEQADVMTHLLWEAADAYEADLVVPLDADEFLVPTGGASCRAVLEQLPTDDVRSVHWHLYASSWQDGAPADLFRLAQPLYRNAEPIEGQKVIVGGALVRRDHVRLSQGNHQIGRRTETEESWTHGPFLDAIEIAHFFWRSPEQIQSKYAVAWPNIVAKYTLHTAFGGGYRKWFDLIRRGGVPGRDEEHPNWQKCDLRGRVPLPKLRYSKSLVPNVLANVMAASEALAEELAETRAFADAPLVTTIVPYLGEDAAFCTSFASACAEDYPWRELVVPVLAGDLSTELTGEVTGQHARILDEASSLPSSVHGKYVEWLLPGETVRSEKLRRMTACMERHGLPFPLLLSDGGGTYPDISPFIDFDVPEGVNFQMPSASGVWKRLLAAGKYPSRGLAGVLMRRDVFETASRVPGLFDGGRPHLLAFWRALLFASSEQPCKYFGVLRDNYAGAAPACSLEALAAHQMDWHALCEKDGKALLSAEERQEALDRQRKHGIYLLEQALSKGCDMTSGIWPAYQEMLVHL